MTARARREARWNRVASALTTAGLAVWLPSGDPTAPHAALQLAVALGYGHLIGAALGGRRVALPGRGEARAVASGACLVLGLFALWTGLASSRMAFRLAVAVSVWHVLENDLSLARLHAGPGPAPPTAARSAAAGAGAFGLVAALPPLPLFAAATLYHVMSWLWLSVARVSAARTRPRDPRGLPASRRRRTAVPGVGRLGRLIAVHAGPAGVLLALHLAGSVAEPARQAVFSPSLYAFAALLHVTQTMRRRIRGARESAVGSHRKETSHGLD